MNAPALGMYLELVQREYGSGRKVYFLAGASNIPMSGGRVGRFPTGLFIKKSGGKRYLLYLYQSVKSQPLAVVTGKYTDTVTIPTL